MELEMLPEDCFAHILSLTSPGDAIRASPASSAIRSLAGSDNVWEKFLPSDWRQVLSRLASPLAYQSKKEMFLRLCNPHLIDGGTKLFYLQRATGKKCYILSARELSITWACSHLYWSWKPHLQSRFAEVAELRTICWLQIQGKLNTQMLSPRTHYGAYLIVKFAKRAHGLDTLPSEVSLEVGNFKSLKKVYLRCPVGNKQQAPGNVSGWSPRIPQGEGIVNPRQREDGWVEIELGGFYNDGGQDEEATMGLKEVTGEHLKGGLIVEGIELRPKEG